MLGDRFLVLAHVGRRSGRRYRTVLEVIGTDPLSGELYVLAGLGRGTGWYRNLQASSDMVDVAIARRRVRATHRTVEQPEAIRVIAGYERRHRIAAPVIRRVLSRLLGWRYDGSGPARRRLTRELPIVALQPHDRA
jgi:deazaflavin-dependent oxidoreductase (nitroreductase family)